MAALGWLLNLGFAAGGVAVVAAVEAPRFAAPVPFTIIRIFVRLTAHDEVATRETALLGVQTSLSARAESHSKEFAKLARAETVYFGGSTDAVYASVKGAMQVWESTEVDDWMTITVMDLMAKGDWMTIAAIELIAEVDTG